MTEKSAPLQSKLKVAAILLIAGLVVEGFSLYWAHPTSFLLFMGLGGTLVIAGIAIYLIAISHHQTSGKL